MKLIPLLVCAAAGLVALYLLHKYYVSRRGLWLRIHRKPSVTRDHYTVVGGSWYLQWSPPTEGTPPFTYNYEIHTIDVHGNDVIVQSGTNITSTSVVLDSTKLVPDPETGGGFQSEIQYTAKVTAVNVAGTGPQDSLDFTVYDTPTVLTVINDSSNRNVYQGGNVVGDIFAKTGANAYSIANLSVDLADQVASLKNGGITASVLISGTTYPVDSSGDENGPSGSWALMWDSSKLPSLGPNQSVQISTSFTNPAGTGVWERSFTTPAPDPVMPGAVTSPKVALS